MNSFDLASALKEYQDSHNVVISIVGGPTREELEKQDNLEFSIGMGAFQLPNFIFAFGGDTLGRLSIDKSRLDICSLQKQGNLRLFGRDCLASKLMLGLSCLDSPYDLADYSIDVIYNCTNKSGILTLTPASTQHFFAL